MQKLCVVCKSWYMYYRSDWSDVTPGEGYCEGCDKGHWSMDQSDVEVMQLSEYRKLLKKAATCPDFELVRDMEE